MNKKRKWYIDGNLIYCLKHAGWKKGKEIFENDITFTINIHGKKDKEINKFAIEIHKMLSESDR
jgi:hypothetical protein